MNYDCNSAIRDVAEQIQRQTETLRSIGRAINNLKDKQHDNYMKIIDTKSAVPSHNNWVITLNNLGFLGLARYHNGKWHSYMTRQCINPSLDNPINELYDHTVIAWISFDNTDR